MSGVQEYMLQVSAVHLKALVNEANNVVDNASTFLSGDWILIEGLDGKEPIALQSLQVP